MRRFAIGMLGAGLLFAAVPAVAGEATTAPNVATAASGTDPDQVVCVQMQAPTGSRIGGGMQCHTVKEWADLQRSGADQMNMIPRDGLGAGAPGSGMPGGGVGGPR